MSKFILTDVDDTVLEFAKCFQEWSAKHGHFADDTIRSSGCIGSTFGLSDEATWDLIEKFYQDAAFGEITPEPCALEVIPRLHKAGYEFVAITACSDEPHVVEKRRKNLRDAFGFNWYHVHCTGVRQSKEKFLWTYEPSLWVEDNAGHAAHGADIGHHAVLLDRDYNRDFKHQKVTRVADWREIEERILPQLEAQCGGI